MAPAGRVGADRVDVREQAQHRAAFGSREPRDEVRPLGVGTAEEDVEAGLAQDAREELLRGALAARWVDGVEAHQRLQHRDRVVHCGAILFRRHRCGGHQASASPSSRPSAQSAKPSSSESQRFRSSPTVAALAEALALDHPGRERRVAAQEAGACEQVPGAAAASSSPAANAPVG